VDAVCLQVRGVTEGRGWGGGMERTQVVGWVGARGGARGVGVQVRWGRAAMFTVTSEASVEWV
jgi:hypothetical protein